MRVTMMKVDDSNNGKRKGVGEQRWNEEGVGSTSVGPRHNGAKKMNECDYLASSHQYLGLGGWV